MRLYLFLIIILLNTSCCYHSKETVINDVHEIIEQNWCNTADSEKTMVLKNGICKEYFKGSLTNEYSYTVKIGNKGENGYHFATWFVIFKSIRENVEKTYRIVSGIQTDVLVLADESKTKMVFNKDCKVTDVSGIFKSEKLNL